MALNPKRYANIKKKKNYFCLTIVYQITTNGIVYINNKSCR